MIALLVAILLVQFLGLGILWFELEVAKADLKDSIKTRAGVADVSKLAEIMYAQFAAAAARDIVPIPENTRAGRYVGLNHTCQNQKVKAA